MNRPHKVVAYIIRAERLLVFAHTDDPNRDRSGLQVPAGTVRHGEIPIDAVLREALEETALPQLRVVQYLGAGEYDMRPYANSVHVRHYFHLETDAIDVPERWYTEELGDGTGVPIRFELFWIPLGDAHVVAAGQAAFLGRLYD
jgi:8-oxo-dGTP diphosphatase